MLVQPLFFLEHTVGAKRKDKKNSEKEKSGSHEPPIGVSVVEERLRKARRLQKG